MTDDKVLSEEAAEREHSNVARHSGAVGATRSAQKLYDSLEALRAKLKTAQGKLEESEWLVKKLRERLETAEAENERLTNEYARARDDKDSWRRVAEKVETQKQTLVAASKAVDIAPTAENLAHMKAALDAIEKGEE